MCLRQLLDVGKTVRQRIVVPLHGADPQHVQEEFADQLKQARKVAGQPDQSTGQDPLARKPYLREDHLSGGRPVQ